MYGMSLGKKIPIPISNRTEDLATASTDGNLGCSPLGAQTWRTWLCPFFLEMVIISFLQVEGRYVYG